MRNSIRALLSAVCMLLVGLFLSCGNGGANSNPVTSIDIAPISPTLAVGSTQQFTATGHFADGTTGDLTHQANWSSSVTSVATIQNIGTQPGLATAVAVGTTQITVSFAQGSNNVTASTSLTVQ